MDWDNLPLEHEKCPAQHQKKVRGFYEFFQKFDSLAVPNPYYGGAQSFEEAPETKVTSRITSP
jgi:protein-tyrosine phosphatase